ncbi:MAG: tetratricopeptide repeat protein, partial [Gammaproteobacteria bacterium]|nr:tetratricopeptide repeat protein [Gammaproteobacteria bacterium]
IRMAERTIEIDPSNANAYTLLAVANVYNGRAEKAKQFLQQVKRVNPHYPSQVPSVLGLAHLLMGEYQEALAAYDESLLINPTRIPGNVYKLVTLYRMGRSDEANWQREQLMSLHPQFSLEDWARLQPFSDPVIVKDLVGDLEKVGVPH